MFKMDCSTIVFGVFFKVGRKYLTLFNDEESQVLHGRKKIIGKIELTPQVIEKLQKIDNDYDYTDFKRTEAVINLFWKVKEPCGSEFWEMSNPGEPYPA